MRARMAYCGPHGIPLSVFLSWPVDDQAAALGWLADERTRCSNCGTAEWEWIENPDFADAHARICPGCHRIGLERKAFEKSAEYLPGLHIHLVTNRGSHGA